ncbi:MAG: hypothetical protein SWZ49_12100 [Cyanobacteriota bacterium]|nr:hypothetical protein [Cyanobacteriota bacterium]
MVEITCSNDINSGRTRMMKKTAEDAEDTEERERRETLNNSYINGKYIRYQYVGLRRNAT